MSEFDAQVQNLAGHRARFYTTERLGAKQSLTPEGFLLVQDVPLARIGQQLYGAQELPKLKARDGIINIIRDEDEVFKPSAILSFAGKPVTNEHPPVRVTPDNWRQYSVGTVLNPRRGDGLHHDNAFLFGDLLITDRQAIRDVRDGKREVSAGYDADYQQTADGEGRQSNIIGNHVALVQKGRCGPSCMIGDKAMPTRNRLRRSTLVRDRIMDAVRTSNIDQAVEELDKIEDLIGEQVSGDQEVAIHLHHGGGGSGGSGGSPVVRDQPEPAPTTTTPEEGEGGGAMAQILARLERIEQAIVLLAQGEEGEEGEEGEDENGENGDYAGDRRTRDEDAGPPPSDDPEQKPAMGNSAYGVGTGTATYRTNVAGTGDKGTQDRAPSRMLTGDSKNMRNDYNDTVARAELLLPGSVQPPTFDAAASAQATFDALCGLRRQVLDRAYHDLTKRPFIDSVLGGQQANFPKMTCDAVQLAFNGATELARQHNNAAMGRLHDAKGPINGSSVALTPADINRNNREFYKR